ncbi:hypothetical protein PVAP13_3KG430600 [Panicum virgatum]|uniref:Uncharacterized protein n=1 Tax=Panicum virgatum TaxID=38727 RepID=A0A8T0UYR9_PANVG|nr:hypothetical protein PVAP13_3KG430600 [Panicum virgatum]
MLEVWDLCSMTTPLPVQPTVIHHTPVAPDEKKSRFLGSSDGGIPIFKGFGILFFHHA